MSARYGSRTRSGESVSGFGQRGTAGGGGGAAKQMYQEVFTAPGTWTKPANASFVDVIVVGGGGGSAPSTGGGSGGAGRVIFEYGVPVSGPVPVTVGAGGSVGVFPTATPPVPGGDSAFGDTTPPAPPTSIIAGGGGPGGVGLPVTPSPLYTPTTAQYYVGQDAPPIGGGGGGGAFQPNPIIGGYGRGGKGYYGYPGSAYVGATGPGPSPTHPAVRGMGGGTRSMYGLVVINNTAYPGNPMPISNGTTFLGALGTLGFGAVEGDNNLLHLNSNINFSPPLAPVVNTGNARYISGGRQGVVIVEWWE